MIPQRIGSKASGRVQTGSPQCRDYKLIFVSGGVCSSLGKGVAASSLGEEESGGVDGILIPGGFGRRGAEGMILAASWARLNKVPCLGICLGMNIMVIEWARNVLGWADADSTEFNKAAARPVIDLPEAPSKSPKGDHSGEGMRLGKYDAAIAPGTRLFAAYRKELISERHRNRYEFSNRYREDIAGSGLVIGAVCVGKDLVECVECPSFGEASFGEASFGEASFGEASFGEASFGEAISPWGVGVQFHPEFKSKPTAANPLFRDFIAAARDFKAMRNEQ